MSDNFNDELFAQYAAQQDNEAKRIRSGNSFQSNYESIKWTGLEQGLPSVIRVQGGPPDSNLTPYTAKNVTIARIIGDDGKQFKLVRPSFKDDPTYIINKIIQKVRATSYVNGQKVFPMQEKYPDIFNIIDKCGLKPDDKRYKYEKGWMGRDVLIMNVIDRSQMDWHRENKHTMLLAKSVNVDANGNEWPDEGISSFATGPKITQLFKYYGSWEKYDISITRTGDMSNAYIIENASRTPERVGGGMAQFVSENVGLTDEEKSWEKYDISKIYKPTSPIKLYNRLKDTIKKIDRALGTDFLIELKELADAEKARLDAENAESEPETTKVEEHVETPTVDRHVREVSRVSSTDGSDMPYYATLSDLMKGKIKSCVKGATKMTDQGEVTKYDVSWDYDSVNVLPCPICDTDAPDVVTQCPSCGALF